MRNWELPGPPMSPCVRIFLEMMCEEANEIVPLELPAIFLSNRSAARPLPLASSAVEFPFVKRG